MALLSTAEGRRRLTRAWPWVGLVIAAVGFWPVVEWNRGHTWASFLFQWHHGTGVVEAGSPGGNLVSYICGQAGVYTPVLFVLGVMAMVWRWRRFGLLETSERMILLAATVRW